MRFAPTAWAYEPPANAPEVAPRPADGRPITFGCFNNVAKISDTTLQLWGRVLAAVPDSRLLLKGRGFGSEEMRQRYFDRLLAAAGIAANRVEFLGAHSDDGVDHLAIYGRVDISLDTFPYHGTTTTCEALWMGVPVVTLMGDRHVARVSGSLLAAVGRGEWVAATAEDYVRIATQLASNPAELAAHTLRPPRPGAPLTAGRSRRPVGPVRDGSPQFLLAELVRKCASLASQPSRDVDRALTAVRAARSRGGFLALEDLDPDIRVVVQRLEHPGKSKLARRRPPRSRISPGSFQPDGAPFGDVRIHFDVGEVAHRAGGEVGDPVRSGGQAALDGLEFLGMSEQVLQRDHTGHLRGDELTIELGRDRHVVLVSTAYARPVNFAVQAGNSGEQGSGAVQALGNKFSKRLQALACAKPKGGGPAFALRAETILPCAVRLPPIPPPTRSLLMPHLPKPSRRFSR